MEAADSAQLIEIVAIRKRRLHELAKQAATYGIRCPPEIIIEIEDIKLDIEHFESLQGENNERLYTSSRIIADRIGSGIESVKNNLQNVSITEELTFRIFGINVLKISKTVTRLLLSLTALFFIGTIALIIQYFLQEQRLATEDNATATANAISTPTTQPFAPRSGVLAMEPTFDVSTDAPVGSAVEDPTAEAAIPQSAISTVTSISRPTPATTSRPTPAATQKALILTETPVVQRPTRPAAFPSPRIYFRMDSDWGSVFPGQECTYKIVVRNVSGIYEPITDVEIKADVPRNLTILSVSSNRELISQQGNLIILRPETIKPEEEVEIIIATKINDSVEPWTTIAWQSTLSSKELKTMYSNVVSVLIVGMPPMSTRTTNPN